MKSYLRGTQKPIPDNLGSYLTDLQKSGLCQLENYGWRLEFVRRPTLRDIQAIIADEYYCNLGVLQKDGTLSTEVDVLIRH